MIWGYRFAEIESHLTSLGFRKARTTTLTVIFLRDDGQVFTIRRPNELGSLPENLVLDAFDNAKLSAPPPAAGYVD